MLSRRQTFARSRAGAEARRAFRAGYEVGYNGEPRSSEDPSYAAGHAEGLAAAARREAIRFAKERSDSIRTAAPEAARLLERLAGRA